MKIISAAHLFGRAALSCGLWVSQKDDYPVTVQSGHSLSKIKISRGRIDHLGIDAPDAVLIVSQDGLKEAAEILPRLGKDAVVIAAKGLKALEGTPSPLEGGGRGEGARFIELDLSGLDKTVHATAMFARYLTLNQFMPRQALRAAIEAVPKDKIRELNLKAFEYGENL
jgi:Pyruvate/2-oxoacid:ferredoxin oxidoreductase gamma subunit